jgi:Zn-dependent M28 family amino/carboxypeptidase
MKKHLPLDRKIVGHIYTSGEMAEHMTALCDDLPHRFAGSKFEKRAAEYVEEAMTRVGLRSVRSEPFPITGWKRTGPSAITVMSSPRSEIPCITLPYSPSTSGNTLDLFDLGWASPEEIARAGEAVQGKAVLVNLGVPPDYPRRLHRAEKYGRAVEAGAAAFLFANAEPGQLEPTGSARFGRKAEIPAVGVSFESGAFFRRLLGRGRVRIRLLTAGRTGRMISQNVVGEIPGKTDEFVVVGGHLDSHDIAPGASDNASGVVTLLAMASALMRARVKPLRTIRFVTFGSEENGLNGSAAYVQEHSDETARVRLMFNIDTVPATLPMGLEFHNWPGVDAFTARAEAEMNLALPVTQKLCLYSDHFNFFLRGIPTARIASEGDPRAVRGWGHTRADTIDKVDIRLFRHCADLCARYILRAADDPRWPLRLRSQEEVEAFIVQTGKRDILRYEE